MKDTLGFVITIILALLIVIAPFMYLEGTTRSQYLKERKGIEVVWYRAICLPDTVFVDVKVGGGYFEKI